MESFYVVWQPETGAPNYRHGYFEFAKNEAERLAAANPGKKFYVLRAQSVSFKNDITTVELEDALPF